MTTTTSKTRKCLWCGEDFHTDHPTKQFCTKAHQVEAGNYMTSRGKVVMPMLLAWRAKRGRKGTSGADAYQDMQRFIDACVAELSEQGCPSVSRFYEAPRANGYNWMDRKRRK